ncbi:hypothetical protein MHYP_G00203530 [Metynnis hypsauchen]
MFLWGGRSVDQDTDVKKFQDILSGIEKPQVCSVQARTARLRWTPPAGLQNRDRLSNGHPYTCTYEVTLSDKGRDGKFHLIYSDQAHIPPTPRRTPLGKDLAPGGRAGEPSRPMGRDSLSGRSQVFEAGTSGKPGPAAGTDWVH